MRFADDTNTAVRPISGLRFDSDVHILTERCQKTHKAFAGEMPEPSIEQRRHLRLIDAQEPRGRDWVKR